MLPSYLHNNVFSAPNWTFVHGFCVLVPNYVANHVVFWSNFCRESRCFGDTFRPLKKLIVTQKGFFAGLPLNLPTCPKWTATSKMDGGPQKWKMPSKMEDHLNN